MLPPGAPFVLLFVLCVSLVIAAAVFGRRTRVAGLVVAVAALFFTGLGVHGGAETGEPPRRPRQFREDGLQGFDGYVGSQTCRSCHPHEHATWHASYHRSMTQVPSRESVEAPFAGERVTLEGWEWEMQRRGDDFWAVGRAEANGEATERTVERRIVLMTGSHHNQVYWLEPDHAGESMELFQLVFLIQERQWIPRKSRLLVPPVENSPDESGRWEQDCIKCHTTRSRPVHPVDGETRVSEFGISCEACHGPGAEHVARNRQPLRRYTQYASGEPDPTIVNPARLPHDRATGVCGQCHGVHFFTELGELEEWRNEGFRFRPGDDLLGTQIRHLVRGRKEDNSAELIAYLERDRSIEFECWFWSDGTPRVTGRELNSMLETPCYQRGTMSCLSCHTMHVDEDDPRTFRAWAEDQLGRGLDGYGACVQCHDEYADDESIVRHTRHGRESAGSDCYNCHMPYTSWGLINAIRAHVVDSPDVATTVATGRPNACNQCHLDRTLLWAAEHLEDWYGIEQPELSADERAIAASVLWTTRGDANQRALMSWSFGWEAARTASGSDWMVPYLGLLLTDGYDAVRFNALRSLSRDPRYARVNDSSGVAPTRETHLEVMRRVVADWSNRARRAGAEPRPELLLGPNGRLDRTQVDRLLSQRDHRPVALFE